MSYRGPVAGNIVHDAARGRCRVVAVRDFSFDMQTIDGPERWYRVSDSRARAACGYCGEHRDAPECVRLHGDIVEHLEHKIGPLPRLCSQECADLFLDSF